MPRSDASVAVRPTPDVQSRRHWLSSRIYKRQLLLGYMIFNAALFAGQLLLYLLLFLPSFSEASMTRVPGDTHTRDPRRLVFFWDAFTRRFWSRRGVGVRGRLGSRDGVVSMTGAR